MVFTVRTQEAWRSINLFLFAKLLNLKELQRNPVQQLDLLKQLTYTRADRGYQSDGDSQKLTIREQLSEVIGDRDGEFSIPLGKKLKASLNSLTISQKRNIKRQAYLDEVGSRNDSTFFAIIGAFVILPPVAILSIAILTGYVQLFP
ncbi:hypothetical protein IHE45_04G075800 [Dioscorea alata]|uniref:Uncharacterized protein n=1 Tax=Dioscorea alata TaxID=55571 RepID=A0ACB7WDH4_DIOAL|nr:hypothetical protein IHE45_04G075800 [Dioscorea alata]